MADRAAADIPARAAPAARGAGEASDVARLFPYLLAAIVLGAALIRLPFLEARSFWFDELFTRYWIELPQSVLWGEGRRVETNPPLYFSALRVWAGLFGTTDGVLRLPSTLASAAAVAVCGLVGRLAFGPAAGLLAALLYAVAPMSYWYAHEARPTAFLPLVQGLGLLACLGYLAAARRAGAAAAIPRRHRAGLWALFVLSSAFGIHLHATGVLFVAASCAVMGGFALFDRQELGLPAFRFWFTAGLAVLAISAPQLLVFLAQAGTAQIGWVPRLSFATADIAVLSLSRILAYFASALAAYREHGPSAPLYVAAVMLQAGLVLNGVVHGVRRREGVALAGIAALFAAIKIGLSFGPQPLLVIRYGVVLTFVAAVLTAGGILSLPLRAFRLAAAAAVVLLAAGLDAAQVTRDRRATAFGTGLHSYDYRGLTRLVAATPGCRGPVVSNSFSPLFGWPHYGPAPGGRVAAITHRAAPPGGDLAHPIWSVLVPLLGYTVVDVADVSQFLRTDEPFAVITFRVHPALAPAAWFWTALEQVSRNRETRRMQFWNGNALTDIVCFGPRAP